MTRPSPSHRDQWLKIGVVARAHGLRGAFFVSCRDDAIPKIYGHVVIGDDPERAPKGEILRTGLQAGRPFLWCSLASSREAAELLSGKPIWVRRSQLGESEEGRYFWVDLIGRTVVDLNGRKLGTVDSIYNVGASDLLVVRSEGGALLEIPLVGDYVDLAFETTEELRLTVAGDVFDELWAEC